MKMLNNALEVDVFATLRIPIQSPRCMKMGEDDLLCGAPPPERPAQVRHHHAEAVAVAVDGVDAREKRYKNSVLPPTVLVSCVADAKALCVANVEARWPLDASANAPRPDVAHPPNDHGVVK